MMEFLKQKLTGFRKAAGLEVVLQPDGNRVFNLVILENDKKQIKIAFAKEAIGTLEEVKQYLDNGLFVALSITGKGILLKKIAGEFSEERLGELLPNAKIEDFLLSRLISVNSEFIALLRADFARQILSECKAASIEISSISCGPEALSTVAPLIEKEEFYASNYKLSFDDSQVIIDVKAETSTNNAFVLVGSDKIASSQLIAFSSALAFFTGLAANTIFDELQQNDNGWKDKIVYKKLLQICGGLIATLVFINLFLFLYLSNQNNELGSHNRLVLEDFRELEEIEKDYKEKDHFLKEAGWMNMSRSSFYIDEIATSVPETVLLRELSVNPVNEGESKKEKKVVLDVNKIVIKGECKDAVLLNPWMNRLKEFAWIEKVSGKKYWFDDKEKAGQFEIEVILNDGF